MIADGDEDLGLSLRRTPKRRWRRRWVFEIHHLRTGSPNSFRWLTLRENRLHFAEILSKVVYGR